MLQLSLLLWLMKRKKWAIRTVGHTETRFPRSPLQEMLQWPYFPLWSRWMCSYIAVRGKTIRHSRRNRVRISWSSCENMALKSEHTWGWIGLAQHYGLLWKDCNSAKMLKWSDMSLAPEFAVLWMICSFTTFLRTLNQMWSGGLLFWCLTWNILKIIPTHLLQINSIFSWGYFLRQGLIM